MKINEIIILTQAGWTKDEIMSLVNNEAQDQGQQSDTQPQQMQLDLPEEQPQQEQPQQPAVDVIKGLETKLDYVINRFNLMAVQQSRQPEQKTESVDDILASVIRGVEIDKK